MDRLEALYRHYRMRLWRLAVRMANDPEVAQDLVQEAFVRAVRRMDDLPASDAAAEAWLVRTVVNLSHDRYRRQAAAQKHDPAFEARRVAPSSPEGSAVARATLARTLSRLPARARAVLVLRDLEGLSFASIAELLGLRQVTVRWHHAKARRQLQRLLAAPPKEVRDG